jgi:stress response protein YsnF
MSTYERIIYLNYILYGTIRMQLPNSQSDAADDDNPIIKKKNDDLKEERNPLIVSPSQSEKVRIIVKSPMLKDKESLISKVEEVFETVKESTSNLINKAIKVEEQDINSFKRFSEKASQPQQQESIEEEFVIPVIAEDYSLSKKTLSEEINIEKRWVEHDEIKIPVRYEKVFVNDKEIDVYSKQGTISQIKEKISDLVQSNKENESEEEREETKNQNDNKDIENKKREVREEEELQLKGEIVPLFDNQQNEYNTIHSSSSSNNEELTKNKNQALIPIYAEEITISKKLVKVGEILLSKRRVIEEENVNVDTSKERISVEHPDGRKEKLTGY